MAQEQYGLDELRPRRIRQRQFDAALFKPPGDYFAACAEGRLLMIAPGNWPYIPGEKKLTRLDAVAMNRLCQLLAGDGMATINYKGMLPGDIDALARAAVCAS